MSNESVGYRKSATVSQVDLESLLEIKQKQINSSSPTQSEQVNSGI